VLIEQQLELFLEPILTQHDFLTLMTISSRFSSRSHILSSFSHLQMEGVISSMSSAYRITYIPPVDDDDLARSSKYIASMSIPITVGSTQSGHFQKLPMIMWNDAKLFSFSDFGLNDM